MKNPQRNQFLILFIPFFTFSLSACLPDKEEPLSFFDVEIPEEPQFNSDNTVTLSLEIVDFGAQSRPISYGFKIYHEDVEIKNENYSAQISGNKTLKSQPIALNLCANYEYQPWVKYQEREIAGETRSINFNVIVALQESILVSNDSVTFTGLISGIRSKFSFPEHGFYYSTLPINDTTDLDNATKIDSGFIDTDRSFSSKIAGLDFNKLYYVVAYVKDKTTFCLSEPSIMFNGGDGWELFSRSILPQTAAFAFEVRGFIYFGLGSSTFRGDSFLDKFWKLNPADGSIEELQAFPGIPREGAMAFKIQDTIYYGMGLKEDIFFNDLWAYFPTQDTNWIQLDSTHFFPEPGRRDVFSLVINDKAIVGGGDNEESFGAFFPTSCYSFDPSLPPEDLKWRQIQSMVEDPFDVIIRGATTFTLNGEIGYVAFGESLNADSALANVWKYEELEGWNMLMGNEFPGQPRIDASAFVIDGIAYVGLGSDLGKETYFSDFYQFNESGWVSNLKVSPFIEDGRSQAAATAVNGYGFILGGRRSNGFSETAYSRIYKYIPSMN